VITARQTRLLRAADLQAFQHAIARAALADAAADRRTAVVVPSRAAADELRRTLPATDLLTRDELYVRLHEGLADAPPLLSAFEREVMFRRASRHAAEAGYEPPFQVRPALVAQMLALYDELRRNGRTVAAFDRLMTGSLEPSVDTDRGAERMLRQTRFLVAAFTIFETDVASTGGLDEHALRARLLDASSCMYGRIVVTVADQAADRLGLWPADFDLLARLPGLEHLDVVATEALLAAGFHERIHALLPAIDEVREPSACEPPVLVVPGTASRGGESRRAFVCRDREEELADIVRLVKTAPRKSVALERTAVVFQRPLPYLYLAREVFADGRVAYQATDSLPLAAEPFAAAIDLIFACLTGESARTAMVQLLASPHFTFERDGRAFTSTEVAALDAVLVSEKYLGGAGRLAEMASTAAAHAAASPRGRLARFEWLLSVAAAVAAELQLVLDAPAASAQIGRLLDFIGAHERPAFETADDSGETAFRERHLRARSAILSAIGALRDAHARYDVGALSAAELANEVRRWIEAQTFSPRTGSSGVRLLDARAAAYADVDELRLVGLVEGDWPERAGRSIFYPQSLLSQLGWASDPSRLAAARAQFFDLLHLPQRRVSLSTFTLEDDALVPPSPFLEDVDAAGLAQERHVVEEGSARVFEHEALMEEPLALDALEGPARAWMTVRLRRADDDREHARFHGETGPRAPEAYGASHLERYLECPFKYFAARVLRLPEERGDEGWLTPQERGQLVHEVFCAFFGEWQRLGRGAITIDNVAEASRVFATVAEAHLAMLPEADRALERTFLLGSAAASGLADRAFAFEIEHGTAVIERLLEHELEGIYTFRGADGDRLVNIRSKADRIDLLEDGTLRIVDYKLSRAPKNDRALQLPVYGACAEQSLDGRHGRRWKVSRAGYVAFKEKQPFTPAGGQNSTIEDAMAAGQAALVATVDAIERGEFPVRPDEPYRCTWCAYPSVCRKDYVGDE
jgi:RecB family exonuclease